MNQISLILQRMARRIGFEVHRMPGHGLYETVRPIASYSPWNTDPDFSKCYEIIRNYTLVDKYRCYELWNLVAQSAKALEGDILEVGVWKGGSGALLASQAARCGLSASVYLCDTFRGVVKTGPSDSIYKGGEHADTSRKTVEKLIDTLDLKNVEILTGVFPDDTAVNIADRKFRFCHIDVDVYQSAEDILEWVWGRLVRGGIIVYDDYGFKECNGIVEHVAKQFNIKDRVVMHNLNGHAVIIKL